MDHDPGECICYMGGESISLQETATRMLMIFHFKLLGDGFSLRTSTQMMNLEATFAKGILTDFHRRDYSFFFFFFSFFFFLV